jgi:hypothetical protein
MTQSDDTKIDALFAALFGHWVRNLCCNFWCNFLGVNDPPECTSINGNEHFGTEFIASLKMLKEHLLFFLLDELSAFCYYVILIYRQLINHGDSEPLKYYVDLWLNLAQLKLSKTKIVSIYKLAKWRTT